jgi:hypothetical protein
MVETTAGDEIPVGSEVIEVHVAELRQVFNSFDPAPFRERDLDPKLEAFIVEWSQEIPRHVPLALRVRVGGPVGPEDGALLRDAVHQFFARRARSYRRRLRQLFHVGRISLLIGLGAMVALVVLGQIVTSRAGEGSLGTLLHESLLIGGWVAMWRPLNVFLYDWWPIRADARLCDRLAMMPVRLSQASP